MSRSMVRQCLASGLILVAVWSAGQAGYIWLKAELAQVLIERAWQRSDQGHQAIRPWSWADTWPVAQLSFPRLETRQYVLAGASGRNLAFGPVAASTNAWPGQGAATLIAGHRDTHFKGLSELRDGDRIDLQRGGQRWRYRVTATERVHETAAPELEYYSDDRLVLITCWPFKALNPNTPWRYLVHARLDPHSKLSQGDG